MEDKRGERRKKTCRRGFRALGEPQLFSRLMCGIITPLILSVTLVWPAGPRSTDPPHMHVDKPDRRWPQLPYKLQLEDWINVRHGFILPTAPLARQLLPPAGAVEIAVNFILCLEKCTAVWQRVYGSGDKLAPHRTVSLVFHLFSVLRPHGLMCLPWQRCMNALFPEKKNIWNVWKDILVMLFFLPLSSCTYLRRTQEPQGLHNSHSSSIWL